MRGDQPVKVRGVAAVANPAGGAELSVQVGRVLIYLEDRDAFEALRRALVKPGNLADDVFGREV
jgi:hypothetical protein